MLSFSHSLYHLHSRLWVWAVLQFIPFFAYRRSNCVCAGDGDCDCDYCAIKDLIILRPVCIAINTQKSTPFFVLYSKSRFAEPPICSSFKWTPNTHTHTHTMVLLCPAASFPLGYLSK